MATTPLPTETYNIPIKLLFAHSSLTWILHWRTSAVKAPQQNTPATNISRHCPAGRAATFPNYCASPGNSRRQMGRLVGPLGEPVSPDSGHHDSNQRQRWPPLWQTRPAAVYLLTAVRASSIICGPAGTASCSAVLIVMHQTGIPFAFVDPSQHGM